MTPYSPEDLRDGWEFKIVRSATDAFRHSAFLRRICEEEARAGWVMVEKFDNGRVRFKRPASARSADLALPFDPYRTYVGIRPSVVILLGSLGILAFVGLIFLLIAWLD